MPRILLVRHGHSTKTDYRSWVPAAGVSAWEDAYDVAGIRDDSHPPEDLRAIAASACLASSDLPRAIASVERLAPAREYNVTPLLRELRLEPPRWIPTRLPMVAWDTMSALQWTWRLSVGADHQFIRRAHEATDWLIELARDQDTVVAVTHGGFRRILERAFLARSWRASRPTRPWDNWSVWSFTPP